MRVFTPFSKQGLANTNSDSESKLHRSDLSHDLINTTRFFYLFALTSLAAVVWHCGFTRSSATSLLWALACSTVGAGFGFLFGIPKILQSDKLKTESSKAGALDYRQQVNTNLTEISDWLTKIIVGLGLIQLHQIPPFLNRIADPLAVSLNSAEPYKEKAFALALIICFLVFGFLFGYLSTRLFLQGAFSRADQEAAALRRAEDQLATTDARVANIEIKQDLIFAADNPNTARESVSEGKNLPHADSPPINTLRKLASEYTGIQVSERQERIRLKNESGKAMFNFVTANHLSKDDILKEAELSGNEGVMLTLANMILAYPEKGDIGRLMRVAFRAKRWHVQYRIVQAFGQLFEKHCAKSADVESVRNILTQYEKTTDTGLLRQIKGTRTLIENLTTREGDSLLNTMNQN
jgi:hypothetical protein